MLPTDQLNVALDASNSDLEHWKMSIPEQFRPGSPSHQLNVLDSKTMALTLRLHYNYYSAVIASTRLGLSIPERESTRPIAELKEVLLGACSTVIGLTKYIDIAPYSPIWLVVCLLFL